MKCTKQIILVLFLLSAFFSLYANSELSYINLSAISNIDKYSDDLLFAMSNDEYLETYIADDWWNAPYSRAEYVTRMTSLFESLVEYEEPQNQEYLLLKAVIGSFLYNLDEMNYHTIVEETYLSIEQLPSYDYRYLWFLGKFYVDSSRIEQGVRCYESIFSQIPREYLHPDLFLYSSRAYYVAGMLNCSVRDFEMYESMTGNSVEGDYLYMDAKSRLLKYDPATADADILLKVYEKGDVFTLNSSLYGLRFVPMSDWIIQTSQFQSDRYIFMASSPVIESEKGNASYTALVLSCLSESPDTAPAAISFRDLAAQNNATVNTTLFPDCDDITVIEWTNPEQYPNVGGAHAYAALVTKPYSATADCDMESPYDGWLRVGETTFYQMQNTYKRYEGYVVTLILFDSCENINGKTKDDFVYVMSQSAFY